MDKIGVVNIGYNSTNYYAIHCNQGYLLIDTGLPGTLEKMMSQFRKYGIRLNEIRFLAVTHFHPDHCGIAEELQALGIDLIVSEKQSEYLESANESMRKFRPFKEIVVKPHNILVANDRISFSQKTGLSGYLLCTPGHSEDSISVVIEGLGVFTGDLPLEGTTIDSNGKIKRSWAQIIKTNERTVFPGHGRTFEI
ncbi:MBL fold metallo-hydrolase [Cohnella thailandensis]|uniref:MBL fold metallo-hydrolase n=1 Tax=Cohnella thailandensis TaxID=557557 RepID=A0A841SUG5_9BACL|nr:MBL fold metallo-hydrolase [Cohnella thailandensis]MBB6634902.1 MBL fold metallo-hydrolase [Cohnella thailandensis]MBP1975876.1 glyoxylase-like metal-dependent hydrolase (beta-lactamase superfamily II) [Cohnella thailandensis]